MPSGGIILIEGGARSENGIRIVHLKEPPEEPIAATPETPIADEATTRH
jgi:hypothetical protein